MAELLVKSSDTTNPDPIKDLRGCYKKGDVVVVKPDGWKWGKEELNKNKFYILCVPDKEVDELKFLTKEDEIVLGNRYIAESPELGVMAEGPDAETASKTCQTLADAVLKRLQDHDLSPSYQIVTRIEPIRHVVARRRHRINIEDIEDILQSEVVAEVTSDKISVTDKPQKISATLAKLAK
ncbi:hypothetical protein J7J18_07000 [bacterium]|nr:hypothetical protein [bacterium]